MAPAPPPALGAQTPPLNNNDLGKLPVYGRDAVWNEATTQSSTNTSAWYPAQDNKTSQTPRAFIHSRMSDTAAPPPFPSDVNTYYEQLPSQPPVPSSDVNSADAGYYTHTLSSRLNTGYVYEQPQSGFGPQEQPMEDVMNIDTMAMWNDAPSGFK